jgi:transaldolase
MVKVPGSVEGALAVRRLTAAGVNVNITLLFAIEAHERVIDAYMAGLEDRVAKGQPIDGIASVASFFVSRVDTAVDQLLGTHIGAGSDGAARYEALLGQAAIANARLAYAVFQEIFAGSAWDELAARGAQVQRPLWASTSTKNPRYRDVRYVEELIGPDTVNTLPPATLEAFKDHGRVTRTLDTPEALERARQTMRSLQEIGIDMAEVTLQLQRDGVKSFADSYDQLIQTLEERRRTLARA